LSAPSRPITFSIAALGGQGGGVITDWLVLAARSAGYIAQATSVPGVAQRTGATIYYLEFFPRSGLRADGREPVMALMPSPGDVDVVVASELLEAGRAINRGLVTPNRTTLIASTHRDYTISEKSSLGDGRADSDELKRAAAKAAARFVAFDMAAVAEKSRGHISAVIFGAISGSGVLPWSTEHFEAAIRESGVGVGPSLVAFEAGREAAMAAAASAQAGAADASQRLELEGPAPEALLASIPTSLRTRLQSDFPPSMQLLLARCVLRLVDYQDERYAALYLQRVSDILALEPAPREAARLAAVTARSLALWMSFEDVLRVAQLKTRPGRQEQVRREVRAAPGEIVVVNEFVKPRVDEICATLPAGLGRRMQQSARAQGLLSRFTAGRQISTSKVGGFLLLRSLSVFRRLRRGTLRYVTENARIERWLEQIKILAATDYELAVEIAECQNLVKGYGSTHERGWRSFGEICSLANALAGTGRGAAQVRALRAAALADESGEQLGRRIAELKLAGTA
jgi:indolepyruvate ferredoxin oxidoreductase, beta subunit